MSTLSMTESEIRMRYRDGTSVSILADLNACTDSKIREILSTEPKSVHPDKIAAPKPKQMRNRNIDWGTAEALYKAGMIDREIAAAVGASSPSVCSWRHKKGYPANCSKADAGRRSQRSPKREFPKQDQPIANETTQITNEPIESEPRPKDPDVQFTHSFPEPDCIIEVPYEVANQMVVDHLAASICIEDYPGKKATGKPRLSLVPPALIEAVSRVRTFITADGGKDNWPNRDPATIMDELMFHTYEYLRDSDAVDEDTGLSHLDHMACHVSYLCEIEEREKGRIK